VIQVLKAWREALDGHVRRSVKHDLLGPDCVVFPNDMGTMRSYDGFRATYRRFMDKNALGNYSLHCYRHTFATMLLVERGVNVKIVSKLLGHADVETTLGVYSHVLSGVCEGVAGVVGELYKELTAKGTEKGLES
jgi:site-specific recombinase XerD